MKVASGVYGLNFTLGELSWTHNAFPNLWNTPGGDCERSPIGKGSAESEIAKGGVLDAAIESNLIAEFTLSVDLMELISH